MIDDNNTRAMRARRARDQGAREGAGEPGGEGGTGDPERGPSLQVGYVLHFNAFVHRTFHTSPYTKNNNVDKAITALMKS